MYLKCPVVQVALLLPNGKGRYTENFIKRTLHTIAFQSASVLKCFEGVLRDSEGKAHQSDFRYH
jgi:hypothetical protein